MPRKARIIECIEFSDFCKEFYSIYRLQHKYFGLFWLTTVRGIDLAQLISCNEAINKSKNRIVWQSED